jgi:two-component system cell cycle sensor histidine kinase PleC
MLNLLSNAIKFTDPGGRVTLRAGKTGDGGIALQVEDTGLGMDAAEVEIALEPFGQVDAGLNRRRDGAGLGLPLARSLIEQHGGTMRIDSEKGGGTRITVSLPPDRIAPAKPTLYPDATAAAA